MERPITKIFFFLFTLSTFIWLYASSVKHYETGILLKFGTGEFKDSLDPAVERSTYDIIAKNSIIVFISYPVVLLCGIGYVITTGRSLKQDGWLMMSAILLFLFVPVELYCFLLDWKIVGLNYWGEWELEEFRKAFLNRTKALGGLPLIAQMCYFTIPIFVIFKPLKKFDHFKQ